MIFTSQNNGHLNNNIKTCLLIYSLSTYRKNNNNTNAKLHILHKK